MTEEQVAVLKERSKRLKAPDEIARILGGRGFMLAGGALTKDDSPKDFDIYGVGRAIQVADLKWRVGPLLSKSSNAITAEVEGQVVQFCSYCKETPQKTIEAFDFAHCQAGAVFDGNGELKEVVATDAFWVSEEVGATWYTGSEYPLSSLMRCMKFHKRGLFRDNAHKVSALRILLDIVRRGFRDEGDFLDQCASVSETFCELNGDDADELFELLKKKGT